MLGSGGVRLLLYCCAAVAMAPNPILPTRHPAPPRTGPRTGKPPPAPSGTPSRALATPNPTPGPRGPISLNARRSPRALGPSPSRARCCYKL